MYTINDLYDLDHTLAKDYLSQFTYPWEALKGIKDFILELGPTLDPEEYEEVSENVWVHKTAKVFPSGGQTLCVRKRLSSRRPQVRCGKFC